MYQLFIANKNYSSWSLRPWVLMRAQAIEFEERLQSFEAQDNFDKFRLFSPSGTVPCLVDGETVVWDTLAITEYLAERHDGIWPENVSARTYARCVTAEMHSGFSSLRNICPMNCAIKVRMPSMPDELIRNVHRLDEIFQQGLDSFGGPYLGGKDFSAVDAFFCPVAFRVRSYQLPLSSESMRYVERLLDLPAMKEWDTAAIAETWREESHEEEARAAGEILEDRRAGR